jgi:hypothetical protein
MADHERPSSCTDLETPLYNCILLVLSVRWLINELIGQQSPDSPATFVQHLSPRTLVRVLSPFRLPYSFLHRASVFYPNSVQAWHNCSPHFEVTVLQCDILNSCNTNKCTIPQSMYFLYYLAPTCAGIVATFRELINRKNTYFVELCFCCVTRVLIGSYRFCNVLLYPLLVALESRIFFWTF